MTIRPMKDRIGSYDFLDKRADSRAGRFKAIEDLYVRTGVGGDGGVHTSSGTFFQSFSFLRWLDGAFWVRMEL